jgi:hypothetical protein
MKLYLVMPVDSFHYSQNTLTIFVLSVDIKLNAARVESVKVS